MISSRAYLIEQQKNSFYNAIWIYWSKTAKNERGVEEVFTTLTFLFYLLFYWHHYCYLILTSIWCFVIYIKQIKSQNRFLCYRIMVSLLLITCWRMLITNVSRNYNCFHKFLKNKYFPYTFLSMLIFNTINIFLTQSREYNFSLLLVK